MDVTPHDLRNAELREAFRGYRPDEVEELLERAAITLERMHERFRALQERIAQVEQEASSGREMESVLRQTLLLAQRTADETVTTAHERARQLLEEAEDNALRMTVAAEEQARSLGEAQKAKYEAIVAELSARRDALTIDIDGLERVQGDYRRRLRSVLQRELEELDRREALPMPARPTLHEIDLADPPPPPQKADPKLGQKVDTADVEVDATAPPAPAEATAAPADHSSVKPPSGGSDAGRPSAVAAPPPVAQAAAPSARKPEPGRSGSGKPESSPPTLRAVPSRANAPAGADDADAGPPTEALVVLDEELAENGRSGMPRRRN